MAEVSLSPRNRKILIWMGIIGLAVIPLEAAWDLKPGKSQPARRFQQLTTEPGAAGRSRDQDLWDR
jgi:type II secretory pathway component PulM